VDLTLKIWDTPGGDQFANMRDLDYSGADVCILVYSIDKESTFEAIEEKKSDASKYKIPTYFLVGNKVDLDSEGLRDVEKE